MYLFNIKLKYLYMYLCLKIALILLQLSLCSLTMLCRSLICSVQRKVSSIQLLQSPLHSVTYQVHDWYPPPPLPPPPPGIVLQYFFPSMCWWWLFHIFGVFWKFVFPLHAKKHASRERLLYGVLVVCGVGLPLPGVIATLATEGYAIGRYPPLLCTSKDPDVFYYSVVFLTSVIIAAGLFMLVVLYWTLYKV